MSSGRVLRRGAKARALVFASVAAGAIAFVRARRLGPARVRATALVRAPELALVRVRATALVRARELALVRVRATALVRARGLALVLAPILMVALAVSARAEGWSAEVTGGIGGPSSPEFFRAGWGRGLGIGGGVFYGFGYADLIVQGDFTQFTFDGYEGLGTLGGERRIGRLSLAARVHLWTNPSAGRERLSLEGSGGWGHQNVAGTFGEGGTTSDQDIFGDGTEDGLALTGALEFSRSLYRTTRWSAGVRYTHLRFDRESPAHVAFIMGLRMPLSGSRPQ